MQSEVTTKSVVIAAAEVFDGTIALWEWDEERRGAEAEEAERNAALRLPSQEFPEDIEVNAVIAGQRAQVEAFRSRGPRAWTLCATPDDADGLWALVPYRFDGSVTELEAVRLREEGHLVVQPGESAHDIAEKLKALRHARKHLAQAGAES